VPRRDRRYLGIPARANGYARTATLLIMRRQQLLALIGASIIASSAVFMIILAGIDATITSEGGGQKTLLNPVSPDTDPFTVYVYDEFDPYAVANGTTAPPEPMPDCAGKIVGKEGLPVSARMFAIEFHLHQLLLRHPRRTLDPESASFFYVPVYASCVVHRKDADRMLENFRLAYSSAVKTVSNLPWFARRGGRDHVWTVTHGFGAELLPPEVLVGHVLYSNGDTTKLGVDLSPRKDVCIPGFPGSNVLKDAPARHPVAGDDPLLLLGFQGNVFQNSHVNYGMQP